RSVRRRGCGAGVACRLALPVSGFTWYFSFSSTTINQYLASKALPSRDFSGCGSVVIVSTGDREGHVVEATGVGRFGAAGPVRVARTTWRGRLGRRLPGPGHRAGGGAGRRQGAAVERGRAGAGAAGP